MTSPPPKARYWRLFPLYGAALAAGYGLATAGVPLAWMIGPLLLTAVASVRFGTLPVPAWTRNAGQLIVASAIGINLTPAAVAQLAGNLGVMFATGIALIVASVVMAIVLAKISGLDKATALFSTLPGGPAELAILTERYGGRGGLVAFAQMLRIVIIVTLVPLLLLVGGSGSFDTQRLAGQSDPLGLALVFATAIACAVLLHAGRVVNAWFIGPLLGVGLATVVGLPVTPVPWLLIIAAQIMLGTALGCMFTVPVLRYAARFVPHAIWVAVLITFAGVGFGLAAAWWTGQPSGVLMLANAPGGATEMAVVAKTFALDATLVTAFHLVRIMMIVPTAELIYRAFDRLTRFL